jgi:hypothetical protein
MIGKLQIVWIVGFKKFLRYHYSSTPEGTTPEIVMADVIDSNLGSVEVQMK